MAKKGLIIVVNYNQEKEIGSFLLKLERFADKEHIVVVDDGSKDNSPQIAKDLGFKTIVHQFNRGVGAAIRTGISHATENGYDYVTIMSSNGKMMCEDLDRVRGPIENDEADYVTGSRFAEGGNSQNLSGFRATTIPLYSLICSLFLGHRFSDITCGYRAYSLKMFNDPRVNISQDWLDRYEMEYYIHYWACKLGIRIVEVPVTITYSHLEKGRKSKIKPITGWWSIVRPYVLLGLGIRK